MLEGNEGGSGPQKNYFLKTRERTYYDALHGRILCTGFHFISLDVWLKLWDAIDVLVDVTSLSSGVLHSVQQ